VEDAAAEVTHAARLALSRLVRLAPPGWDASSVTPGYAQVMETPRAVCQLVPIEQVYHA